MKTFVLSCIYGECAHAAWEQARAFKWQKMKKSVIRLPFDDDSFTLHVERTYYIT
jgi:hypothetical protein